MKTRPKIHHGTGGSERGNGARLCDLLPKVVVCRAAPKGGRGGRQCQPTLGGGAKAHAKRGRLISRGGPPTNAIDLLLGELCRERLRRAGLLRPRGRRCAAARGPPPLCTGARTRPRPPATLVNGFALSGLARLFGTRSVRGYSIHPLSHSPSSLRWLQLLGRQHGGRGIEGRAGT